MKKYISDLTIKSMETLRGGYFVVRLTDEAAKLPAMIPGQFVEVRVDGSATTFLRRPISINYVDVEKNELWLLIHVVGDGTQALSRLKEGDRLNVVLPLGNGFSIPAGKNAKPLLIGGGVGTAPMLYMGQVLSQMGIKPTFLLGARSADGLLQLEEFEKYCPVALTTEDGSAGEKGFVTQHSLLRDGGFTHIYTCGPKPMMVAVAGFAKQAGIECEVSLENMMACGVGACLCCVEKTVKGNICVCTEGPVFNIKDLTWQI